MPSSQTPIGNITLNVETLGTVKGLEFANGVRQFVGIPYATLAKRWTRSQLKTTWPDGFHDGTKLGPSAPNPPEYKAPQDPMVPVDNPPHFVDPIEDEFNCLVVNITVPPLSGQGHLVPVMAYIHGGSFLYGSSNKGVFDGVNFVSHSVHRGTPVVALTLNYRVGLGGFLASAAIKADLEADGFEGVGNFGLYDQQVALQWVNRYIKAFGGDPDNVTIYGESAGGMSVSHQIAAQNPAPFHRAIAMSGHLNTIPTWSLERHEKHYRALLTYLGLDPDSPTALEQLRAVPQDIVAAATLPVEGVFVATGNPCDDGIFHAQTPSFNTLGSPPAWLKTYVIGDTLDEGMIFHTSFLSDGFSTVRDALIEHLGVENTDTVLKLYDINADLSQDQFVGRMEALAGDTTFKTQNWVAAHRSQIPRTFGYHFDQPCTHDSPLKGLAYHALDLLYLFLNFDEQLTGSQQKLARIIANHWIDIAHGKDPWPRLGESGSWMRYGPDGGHTVVLESEDEVIRRYSRMQEVLDLGIYEQLMLVIDEIAVKRYRMGTFEWSPPKLDYEIR